jgi:NAD(P)-dependent dehydrogenase (short-subunit alcohol dehydrogenase family)
MTAARIALVTGANRGIGLEVRRQLLAREHSVVLAARRCRPWRRPVRTSRRRFGANP